MPLPPARRHLGFALLLILVALQHFFGAIMSELSPDEAYYWDAGRHLALSYYHHPPLAPYLIRAATWLGGDSKLVLRSLAIGLSLTRLVLLYALATSLFGQGVALASVVLLQLTPLFALGFLMQYDIPQLTLWALAAWSLYQALARRQGRWWYLSGAALGLGFLAKPSMVLFIPSAFLLLLLCRSQRHWLRRREPYLGLLLAALLCLPMALWHWQHGGLESFGALQSSLAARFSRPDPNSITANLGEYLGVTPPLVFLAYLWGTVVLLWQGLKRQDLRYLLVACLALPTLLAGLAGLVWLQDAGGNWPAQGYLTAAMAASALLEKARHRVAAWGLVGGFAALQTAALGWFILSPSIPIPPDLQARIRAQMSLYAWEATARAVNAQLQALPSGTRLVAGDRFLASSLAFATTGQPHTTQIFAERTNYFYYADAPLRPGDQVLLACFHPACAQYGARQFRERQVFDPVPIYWRGQLVQTLWLVYLVDYQCPRGTLRWDRQCHPS
ncbi:MAG: glycosyltransferase family 39 protein [Deinococcus sp.]|nr:glycosyltransferase family 39 protein [Deinococcus sp.]